MTKINEFQVEVNKFRVEFDNEISNLRSYFNQDLHKANIKINNLRKKVDEYKDKTDLDAMRVQGCFNDIAKSIRRWMKK